MHDHKGFTKSFMEFNIIYIIKILSWHIFTLPLPGNCGHRNSVLPLKKKIQNHTLLSLLHTLIFQSIVASKIYVRFNCVQIDERCLMKVINLYLVESYWFKSSVKINNSWNICNLNFIQWIVLRFYRISQFVERFSLKDKFFLRILRN